MRMPSLIAVALISLTCISHAQMRDGEGYTLEDVKQKASTFRGMKIAGLSLLGVGAGANAGGIALSLALKGDEVKAAVEKPKTASFDASLRNKYQVLRSEEVFEYAERLANLFVEKNAEGLVKELLPYLRSVGEYEGMSDKKALEVAAEQMEGMLASAEWLKVDPDDLYIMPMLGRLQYRLGVEKDGRTSNLIQGIPHDDPDDTVGMKIIVVKTDGRIVISEFN